MGVVSEVVASELERIRERDGVLRASVVVREAEPDESPIHDKFTWDDEKAANEFRLIEARTLIRSVIVVNEGRAMPVYAHVGAAAGEGYYQAVTVLVEVEHRDEFLVALNGLRGRLAAAAQAVQALESAAKTPDRLAQLKTVGERVQAAQEAIASVA